MVNNLQQHAVINKNNTHGRVSTLEFQLFQNSSFIAHLKALTRGFQNGFAFYIWTSSSRDIQTFVPQKTSVFWNIWWGLLGALENLKGTKKTLFFAL